jgi:LacI family transcriptional regulator
VRVRVALLIETSRAYGRGLLQGIAAYSHAHGPWRVSHDERALGDAAPRWLEHWDGDGIIARIENQQLALALQRADVPTVDLRGRYEILGVPVVDTENSSIARMAIDHLLDRGFRNFAYTGYAGTNFSELRKEFAIKFLATHGHELKVHDCPKPLPRYANTFESEGEIQSCELSEWLESLVKPVGVFACNDTRARQVLDCCQESGIDVPTEVGVIGVDNDDLLCDLCSPPLSSIQPDTRAVGLYAAALLEDMIAGKPPPEERVYVPPIHVVSRMSTDVQAVDDQMVARVVRLIRERASEGLSVEQVMQEIPLSRSALERRFAKMPGPHGRAE